MEDTRTRTRALDDMMVTPGPGFPGGPFPPMHRVPVFSTMGRGPRGKQGEKGEQGEPGSANPMLRITEEEIDEIVD